MTSLLSLEGIHAALWLPTDAHGGLMRRELASNLAFLKAHRVRGLLALGSTGEFPYFPPDERKRALDVVVELAAPMPVIANISDIRPSVVADLARHARALRLPAVAIMSPGFYPTSQADMLEHFLHAADMSGLPTLLYNFPELTGSRIDLETVAAFAARAPMAGIKQSGQEFSYHRELIALGRDKGFAVLTGADTRLPEAFALGATGCIGGLVNIAPELMIQLYEARDTPGNGTQLPAFGQLKTIGQTIDRLTFPLNVAAGMRARGLPTGAPKALVSAASQSLGESVEKVLRKLLAAWGLNPA